MRTFILSELEKFYIREFGIAKWNEFADISGIKSQVIEDDENSNLLTIDKIIEAADFTHLRTIHFLENFGFYLAYSTHLIEAPESDRNILDVIEHSQDKVAELVHFFLSGSVEPEISIKRISDIKLTIQYSSELFLPAVIMGFLKGVAQICQNDNVEVTLNTYSTCLKSKISVRMQ